MISNQADLRCYANVNNGFLSGCGRSIDLFLPFKTVEKPGPTALLRLVEDLRPIEQNTSRGAVLSVSVRKHIGLSDWCPKADLNVIRVDLTRSDLIRNSDRN
ncbi:MAG: hypothetical protein HC849_21945 [Oscillatoriales cyanobacterium RU_3_3]|nr:hypothetical protein [Oscillatoriales cyanobacterium RU_3_3]